ncbi:MAG: DUF1844 domain-containing protein [Fidelibacterota bacterium]
MPEQTPTKEEKLYLHLVSTYTQSAWIALGKIKNPLTDKTERNLGEAEFYIDLLDMLKSKMKGNLSEWEEKFLESNIANLKLNYVEESRKAEKEARVKEEPEKREPREKKEPRKKGGEKGSKPSTPDPGGSTS